MNVSTLITDTGQWGDYIGASKFLTPLKSCFISDTLFQLFHGIIIIITCYNFSFKAATPTFACVYYCHPFENYNKKHIFIIRQGEYSTYWRKLKAEGYKLTD